MHTGNQSWLLVTPLKPNCSFRNAIFVVNINLLSFLFQDIKHSPGVPNSSHLSINRHEKSVAEVVVSTHSYENKISIAKLEYTYFSYNCTIGYNYAQNHNYTYPSMINNPFFFKPSGN